MLLRSIWCPAFMAIVVVATTDPHSSAVQPLKETSEPKTIPHYVHEEHNRPKRQLRRNTNIFSLFFQLIGETRRDIQKTFNEIAQQLENSIVDENTIQTNATSEEGRSSSTSERQPITRQALTRVLSRNWQGLTRLFNKEVEMAVDQSNRSAAEARKAFWNSLAPFLEPASTTPRNKVSRSS